MVDIMYLILSLRAFSDPDFHIAAPSHKDAYDIKIMHRN